MRKLCFIAIFHNKVRLKFTDGYLIKSRLECCIKEIMDDQV